MPVHVIFMELIIDPVSSIAFEMEPEGHDVMRRPPRDPKQRLFTNRLIVRSLLQGLGACLASAIVLGASVTAGMTELDVRTLTFSTLIMANLALIATNRSLTRPVWATVGAPNPAVKWLGAAAIGALAATVYVPYLRELFRLSTLHANDLLVVAVAALGSLVWMESIKRVLVAR
jgi:Ca2+-transporting ATPase